MNIKLYSPIKVFGSVPYRNQWDDSGQDIYRLSEKEKILCQEKISAEMKKLFSPVKYPADKIRTASLGTEIRKKILFSVLTVECSGKLNPQEMQNLLNWWEWHCRFGFGKRLQASRIPTRKFGRLKIMLWYPDRNWNITLETSVIQHKWSIAARKGAAINETAG